MRQETNRIQSGQGKSERTFCLDLKKNWCNAVILVTFEGIERFCHSLANI